MWCVSCLEKEMDNDENAAVGEFDRNYELLVEQLNELLGLLSQIISDDEKATDRLIEISNEMDQFQHSTDLVQQSRRSVIQWIADKAQAIRSETDHLRDNLQKVSAQFAHIRGKRQRARENFEDTGERPNQKTRTETTGTAEDPDPNPNPLQLASSSGNFLKSLGFGMQLPSSNAAGDFLKSLGFRPGRRKGEEPGTTITPQTLLLYMKLYRKALGKKDDPTEFRPGIEGYIPFSRTKDGLVKVKDGIDLKKLKEGKQITWPSSGEGLPLSFSIAKKMFEPAVKKKVQQTQQLAKLVSRVEAAQKKLEKI